MRLKNGTAFEMIRTSPPTSRGSTITKIHARRGLMTKAATMEKMNIIGLRMAILMIIMKDICTLVTSVVSLVTRLEEENLSMLEKEKV